MKESLKRLLAFRAPRLGSFLACLLLAWVALPARLSAEKFRVPAAEEPDMSANTHLAESWQARENPDLRGRSANTAVWTGTEMITFGGEGMGVSFDDGARYDPAKNAWALLPSEGAPSSRTGHTAVWTGNEMIIWGGFGGIWGNDTNRNDGARYHPASDTWKPVSIKNAPAARFDHTAVWTGKEMLIWGGFTDSHSRYQGGYADAHLRSGGRYDPATDSWKAITTRGAPSKRCWHTAVWTGTEMIIWGGGNANEGLNDGARYNPATDTWTPVSRKCPLRPRAGHVAVWLGDPDRGGCPGGEMLVWGGSSREGDGPAEYFKDGARYNPATDTWTPISKVGAPKGRVITKAVWTGVEMVFWGGVNDLQAADEPDFGRFVGSGGRYNPATDTWIKMSSDGAPAPRLVTAVVWTGQALLLHGGYDGTHLNNTYSYSLFPSP